MITKGRHNLEEREEQAVDTDMDSEDGEVDLAAMKELLLQLTILLLSVGFLWHFGLIKTTSDNEDMNLFLDLTQAVNQLKLQLSKDFSPNLRWVGSVRLSSHCIVENFIVKTITCLLAKVLFQQTFLPLIPTCKR